MKIASHSRRRLLIDLFVCVVACWITIDSFSRTQSAAEDGPQSKDVPVVLGGLDPVELLAGRRTPGKTEWESIHEKLRYRFSSRESLSQFQKAPEKYAVQNQGEALGFPGTKGNPEIFDVHKGKVYLFCTEGCKAIFKLNPDKWTKNKRNVAIFLYPGVELLDFAGPGEVFAATAEGTEFSVYTVAATSAPVVSQGFLNITPKYTIDNCPKPDIIVIPGGHAEASGKDPKVIAWLKDSAGKAEVVFSVCTGAFLLGRAGLLDNQDATTHWYMLDRFKQEFPRTNVKSGVRYTDNGKIVTAAGVSAGIDGALHVVSRLLGKDVAAQTAKYMEYSSANSHQADAKQ